MDNRMNLSFFGRRIYSGPASTGRVFAFLCTVLVGPPVVVGAFLAGLTPIPFIATFIVSLFAWWVYVAKAGEFELAPKDER